jgi:Ca2+-binding RTX toxin-like protein
MAIIPDVVHHIDALPGNDTIAGNDGDDFIVADNASVFSPLLTGIPSIENPAAVGDDTYLALARVMHTLGVLSVDYLRSSGGSVNVPHDVVVASDTIDGGAGKDEIVGDDGFIAVDFLLGIPTDPSEIAAAALSVQNYLMDVEHLAQDFEHVAFEAHYQVLLGMIGSVPALPDPDYHDLRIGNDTIVGGADSDKITGDHFAAVTSIVDGQRFDTIGDQYDPTTWEAIVNTLQAAADQRRLQLDTHVATNHDTANRTLTSTQLNALPVDFEYDREIGNDQIDGQGGNDIVVGDFGAYAFPTLMTEPLTITEKDQAAHEVSQLTAGMTQWLERQHHENLYSVRIAAGYPHPLYEARGGSSTEWATRAGNDTIYGGSQDDFVLGDSMSVSTNIIYADQSVRFSEDRSEFKVAHLDRSRFELTSHYLRFGGLSVFGNDTVYGGDGNDVLFGQTQTNLLYGELGDDELFGGQGPNNIADGGPGGGIARGGSALDPSSIWLDLLEDYQFNAHSGLNFDLSDVLGTDHTSPHADLVFVEDIGNLTLDSGTLALAGATSHLIILP